MLKTKTKDVKIGEEQYRLVKMDARTGSYIGAKIAVLVAPALNGEVSGDVMAKALNSLSRKDFDEIQTEILKRVLKLREVEGQLLPEPIVKGDGSFVDDELAYDTATVINLTVQCLLFNIGGFFGVAGLKAPAQN